MSETDEAPRLKTYNIVYKEKTALTVKAQLIAYSENGLLILLMEGDTIKHIAVAANVIAVTEA